jgi:hypothetical protein
MSGALLISKKLGVHAGDRVALLHAPQEVAIGDLPEGATQTRATGVPDPPVELVVGFYRSAADLEEEVRSLPDGILIDGALWIAWPRRAGGGVSDLTDNLVRGLGLGVGLVDVKVAALGEAWSSLRFVFPRAKRAELERAREARSTVKRPARNLDPRGANAARRR